VFLHRDVDYIVKNGAIESWTNSRGRVAKDRRWPAGLHTALEAKEGVAMKTQGEILGSITLQNMVGLYSHLCGMTGTAATQATEFRELYRLEVEVIPTDRPVIREDASDVVFASKRDKEAAVLKEILRVHATGRPVLVGTQSVEESERLASRLTVAHEVLNARHDETEAAIVAKAGERDAVTISTNMAGRGTDIRLGEGVAELGGLHVIGTNKHESRRIDHQLRGRAGSREIREFPVFYFSGGRFVPAVRDRHSESGGRRGRGAADRGGSEPEHSHLLVEIRRRHRGAAAALAGPSAVDSYR